MNNFGIQELLQKYTGYDMILNHTELPEFPEFRAQLLYAFLNKDDQGENNSELYCLASSLVQIGMDTHDLVPVTNDQKGKKVERARQMKVLAGDYFSARFYHLLSQAGQVDMIKQLSSAICEVNRMKMNLYILMKQLKLTAEDYIQQLANIRMQIFLSFTKKMEGKKRQLWPDILQGFTKCEVIVGEIFKLESMQNINGSWAFWKIVQNGTKDEKKIIQAEKLDSSKVRSILLKYNVTAQLYRMLDAQLQQVWTTVKQLDCESLIEELKRIGEPFSHYSTKLKVLEEL